ncbi:hypothetical protein [Rhizobium phage RHph_X66]|nr:hypothetical protein [Rhizobium phage RHph_X66]
MTKILALIILIASSTSVFAQSAEDTVAFMVKQIGEGTQYASIQYAWKKVGDHFEADWVRGSDNTAAKDVFKIEAIDECHYQGTYTREQGSKDEETRITDYDFSRMSALIKDGPYYFLEGAQGCEHTTAAPYCGDRPNALAARVDDEGRTLKAIDYFKEKFCKGSAF